MIAMESSNCRNYRGHLIICKKTGLGLKRFDIWRQGAHVGRFRDEIAAELHVDRLPRDN